MKQRLLLLIVLLFYLLPGASAQKHGKGYYNQRIEIQGGDTIPVIDMWPVYVFKRPADMRRYARLIYNVKKVYPIAIAAREKLRETEEHLLSLKSKRAQQEYIKQVEKELKAEYTPVLKRMTFSQGKILIKLIDRETDRTSYELVKQLRGNFSAFFWQGVARIFGANLKDHYDKEGEDKIIEQIILLYEAGLI